MQVYVNRTRKVTVTSLAAASRAVRHYIEENMIGSEAWCGKKAGQVFEGEEHIATVSYNGRVWDTQSPRQEIHIKTDLPRLRVYISHCRVRPVRTIEEASEAVLAYIAQYKPTWWKWRKGSAGKVFEGQEQIATISYNGHWTLAAASPGLESALRETLKIDHYPGAPIPGWAYPDHANRMPIMTDGTGHDFPKSEIAKLLEQIKLEPDTHPKKMWMTLNPPRLSPLEQRCQNYCIERSMLQLIDFQADFTNPTPNPDTKEQAE